MRRPGLFRLRIGHRAGSPPRTIPGFGARRPRKHDGHQLVGVRRDHPLARVAEALRCTAHQWNHVAAVLIGSVIARAQGERWASGLVVSSGGVLVALSLLLAVRVQTRRDCVTALILDGREDLPVAVLQRERRRLLSPIAIASCWRGVWRSWLARRQRLGPGGVRLVPPLSEPRVVAPFTDELRELAAVLRTGQVSALSVARLERLVTHATSPLYGHDVRALCEELRRVRALPTERAR
jgi:hypothetical protein